MWFLIIKIIFCHTKIYEIICLNVYFAALELNYLLAYVLPFVNMKLTSFMPNLMYWQNIDFVQLIMRQWQEMLLFIGPKIALASSNIKLGQKQNSNIKLNMVYLLDIHFNFGFLKFKNHS